MTRGKIGAFPRLLHFGPEAVRLGEVLSTARIEAEDAQAELRRLESDAGRSAEEADRALADECFAAGKPMPGTPNKAAHDAAVIEAGARLRAAQAAEVNADEALYRALKAGVDQAADAADVGLDEAAEAHREAIEAVIASRARLLEAEAARRYVDGVHKAIDFERRAAEGDYTARPEFVWPLHPAARPPKRTGQWITHENTRTEDIDRGISAMLHEIGLTMLRPDEGPALASPDTPLRERQFGTSKPRRQRMRAMQ